MPARRNVYLSQRAEAAWLWLQQRAAAKGEASRTEIRLSWVLQEAILQLAEEEGWKG